MPFIEQKSTPQLKPKSNFFDLRKIFSKIGIKIIKEAMQSSNFVTGVLGWKIDADGNAEFQSVTAGGYIQVFVQASIPTSLHINDIWYDSDDGNKPYRAAIVGADQIVAGEWEAITDGTIATAQAAANAAQGDATTAVNSLTDIALDTKITPVEKLTAKPFWTAIVAEKTDIDTQADTYSVSKTAYGTAYTNLNTYLNTTLTVFTDMTATTTIVRATWDGYWEAYYNAKIEILQAIANATALLADWGGVSGANKPADNATVGAIWGTNLTGIPEIRGWSHNLVFSSTNLNTVAWALGTLNLPSGDNYNISAGNTGAMSARTYIYFNKAVSTTVLQTTTTASTAVGTNKILIAVAKNSTTEATFQVYGGIGGIAITGGDIENASIVAAQIAAGTITTNEIAANTIAAGNIAAGTITAAQIAAGTITATEITVAQLSAIAADLGAITAGSININSGVASIDSSGNVIVKSIKVGGSTTQYALNDDGIFSFGDGSDGALSTTGNVTLTSDKYYTDLTINTGHIFNPNGWRIFVNGTLTILGTGKIAGNGNAGGNGGNGSGGTGGTAGTAGSALADGYLKGSVAGKVGVVGGAGTSNDAPGGKGGNGIAGASTTNSIGVSGAAGGAGGQGGSGGWGSAYTGGDAGGGGGATASNVKLIANWHLATLLDIGSTGASVKFDNSAGGGSGGAGSGGSGTAGLGGPSGAGGGSAGSASSGGIIAIYAKKIVIGANAIIQANGANGGNGGIGADATGTAEGYGGGGGGGGGAGSNGGQIILVYNEITNNGTITVSAGNGGALGTGGAGSGGLGGAGYNGIAGTNGTSGTTRMFNLSL